MPNYFNGCLIMHSLYHLSEKETIVRNVIQKWSTRFKLK